MLDTYTLTTTGLPQILLHTGNSSNLVVCTIKNIGSNPASFGTTGSQPGDGMHMVIYPGESMTFPIGMTQVTAKSTNGGNPTTLVAMKSSSDVPVRMSYDIQVTPTS